MNYELRITNKKRIFLSLFIILYSLFFIHGMASAWILGEPIVPCGGQGTCINNACSNSAGPCQNDSQCSQPKCSQCELLHLVDNLMDFILIAAAPILATFFFILAGLYIMLGGAKPDMLATGKRMFTSALVGIIIVMLAWLITNTLITTLIKPNLNLNISTAPGGAFNFNSANWFDLACGTLGLSNTPPGSGGGPPPGPPPPPSGCSAPLTLGTGVRVDSFDMQPRTISASNKNVGITFRVTGNRSLIRNSCGSTANDSFYWTIFERRAGGDVVIRECTGDSRGCPTVTSDHQCFNIDFSISLPPPVVTYPIQRTFYAYLECNNFRGLSLTQSADVVIQDNQ